MAWTTNQQLAIDAEGADILVAAGAGSGKTAVLVERIAREVLVRTDPYNVDDLLVLTFTKAAAEEMRSRLYKRMDKKLEETVGEKAIERIYEQQVRLRRANIGTMDSFCQKLLTENVKESGIDDSWSVCDTARSDLLKDEAANRACERYSQAHPEDYKHLMDVYGKIFSDNGIIDAVILIVNGALNAVYPVSWIDRCERDFTSFGSGSNCDFAETPWGKWLLDFLRLKLEALLGEFKKLRKIAEPIEPYYITAGKDIELLASVAAAFKNGTVKWNDAYDICSNISFSTLNKFKGNKEDPELAALAESYKSKRTSLKGAVARISDSFFSKDRNTPLNDQARTVSDVRALCEMARDAYGEFQNIKAVERLYDYADMERKALEILTGADGGPSELALSYRRKFSEVYVDEYQDNNELQEKILDAICGTPGDRGPEAPFRFMVGDVKQSIYGFRGSCPELFMKRYREYTVINALSDIPAAIGAGSPGIKILLGENFRSRREIIDSVNAVFDTIMNEETAGMPYGEAEHLIYGAKDSYDATSGDPADRRNSPYRTEMVVIDSQGLSEPAKTILEAYEIAERIKQIVAGEFKLVEKDVGPRPVRFSDITILIRDVKKAGSIFADTLRSRGVPVKDTESRYGLFKYPEVRVLTAFLRILDNPLDDIPLLTVLVNIYGFEGELLTRIARLDPGKTRLDPKTVYLYDKLRCFAERGQTGPNAACRGDAELTAAFLARLETLRSLTGRRPVAETIWECMNENGFADAVDRQNDLGVGYGNLMRVLKLASGFDGGGRGGYCDFIRLLDMYESGDSKSISAEPPEGSNDDAVSISTIHKSKGLDYQIVFIAQTYKHSDQKSRDNGGLLLHKELGLGPERLDTENRRRVATAMKKTIKFRIPADNHAEEQRVLYVAMTRAHEKMILTGVVDKYQKFIDQCAYALDPDTGLPSDYNVINTDDYLTHVCTAALGKHGESIALRQGQFTAELVEQLKKHAAEAADNKKAGNFETFRFSLPPMPRWDPSRVTAADEGSVRVPPVKISVSELKRLSNAALAGAEEDAGTTELTLERLTSRKRPELKPLDGGQTSVRDAKQAAMAGTLLHCCLEHIDFVRAAGAGAEGIDAAGRYAEELIADLTARRFFTAEDAKLISRPILTAFICSEFAQELARADYLKREVPFTFSCDSGVLLNDPAFAGRQTAVQGVIDCVYREGGRLILADYKSDRVKDHDYRAHSKQYLIQLSIYAEACRRRFGALPDKIVLYYLRDGKTYEISAAELKRL